jgi:sugar lactone lactonase YvrE
MALRSLKRPGIHITEPDGKEIGFIPTGKPNQDGKNPVGIPSNVCFGRGEESKVLYITVDFSLYRIPVKMDGYYIPLEK